jgi:hypothetical protein
MPSSQVRVARTPGMRELTVLVAGLATLISLWMYFGPVSNADATLQDFCSHSWLNSYGQTNDNCAAGDWHYNYIIEVDAEEHSACATSTTNGAKSGVNNSCWLCTAGPNQFVQNFVSPKPLTVGIIRNNTTDSINHASGKQIWCWNYNCGG